MKRTADLGLCLLCCVLACGVPLAAGKPKPTPPLAVLQPGATPPPAASNPGAIPTSAAVKSSPTPSPVAGKPSPIPSAAAGKPSPTPSAAAGKARPTAKATAQPSKEGLPTLKFGKFGTIHLYGNPATATSVALFVSGDGGWNLGVVDMARELASMDALIIGIDITHYFGVLRTAKDKCAYAAADFEELSHFVQKTLDLPVYHPPVMLGFSSGATLVYAVLAQGPPNTFAGAIGLGFCPDLIVPQPMCRGNGLEWDQGKHRAVIFRPATNLEQPFIALQGTGDKICNPSKTQDYMKQVPHGEVVVLDKVGHGFSVPKNWMPQFTDAYTRIVQASVPAAAKASSAPSDLPLVEIPATGAAKLDIVAVIVSGDGGWASIDREMGQTLAAGGMPVVGLNSLQYFWKARTPDEAGHDLERIVRYALQSTGKSRAMLLGYSLGADVLPFMTSRLPPDLRARLAEVVLLGPGLAANFQFHVTDWLGGASAEPGKPILPEVQKLQGTPILCMYGDNETDSLCPQLPPGLASVVVAKGGHHLGGDYQALAQTILAKLGSGK